MMQVMKVRKFAAEAQIVKAMAHPARLLVVDLFLKHREQCVCELTRAVGTDMSTVSRHLGILKNAGIVVDEKRGAQVFYRLAMGCVISCLECLDALTRQMAEQQQELLRN
jgi:DNA-binding transcriptional ArsR family regulator